MDINEKLVPILQKIKFAERYSLLCKTYCDFGNSLNDKCLNYIETYLHEKEVKFKYIKRESFFKIVEKQGDFSIQFNINPYKGFIQFIWDVKQNKERLDLAWGVWESITEELSQNEVTKPMYSNKEELLSILEEVFSIYEDFKAELLLRLNCEDRCPV